MATSSSLYERLSGGLSPQLHSEQNTPIQNSQTLQPTISDHVPNLEIVPQQLAFEEMRNKRDIFSRYNTIPQDELDLHTLTEPAERPDNGSVGDGQFRLACEYSHFSNDDPIVFPAQPGKSHLHMFFGNTLADAHSTTESLLNTGGGSCNGFELNRSAYWVPALLSGQNTAVVPDQIIIYYKTKQPDQVQPFPAGLRIVAGNTTRETFQADASLGWSCGASGQSFNRSNTIPNNCGDAPINFYIQFPNCWDGKNLDSVDHRSHMFLVPEEQTCPATHPVRFPQITFLLYFPAADTTGWHLSSDLAHGGHEDMPAGSSLHADWFGAWNEKALNLWIDGCIRRSRNCSYGQTGTDRQLAKLNNLQSYEGNNMVALPAS